MSHHHRGGFARVAVVSAVLGAASVVGVACGLAAWGRFDLGRVDHGVVVLDGHDWRYSEQSGPGLLRLTWRYWPAGRVPDEFRKQQSPLWVRRLIARHVEGLRQAGWSEADGLSRVGSALIDEFAGWPLPALRAEIVVIEASGENYAWVRSTRWGVQLRQEQESWPGGDRMWVLPLRPVWPGFVINVALYGVGWAGVLIGAGAARRWARRRRGVCERCAYDLAGQREEGCPECGWGRNLVGVNGA